MAGGSNPFPTRDEVLRFVRESPGRVGRREIARAFGIRGNDRAALTTLLRSLEAEGAIEGRRARRREGRRPSGTLPPVTVLEVDGLDGDGALRARPARWDSTEPPPPIALDPAPEGVREPGVGDRVLARLRRAPDGGDGGGGGGGYLARPMRVLDSGPRRVVGIFHGDGRGGGTIQPSERRLRRDFAVRADESAGARSGELVVGETREGRRLGLPEAVVVERLGAADSAGAISLAAIHGHGLPLHFPDEALAEAERQEAPTLDGRADLRALPLVTIDGADARDFDDAVWAEADPAPDNEGRLACGRRHRRRGPLRAAGRRPRPGGAGARQLRLFSRPRGADAAGGALGRPLLVEAGRGPRLPRRASAHRRGRRAARLALRARAHALGPAAHL